MKTSANGAGAPSATATGNPPEGQSFFLKLNSLHVFSYLLPHMIFDYYVTL